MRRRIRYGLSLLVGVALGVGLWSLRSCSRSVVASSVARVNVYDVQRAILARFAGGV